MEDCTICCEEMLFPTRCPLCKEKACSKCVQTHLLNSSGDFTCMFCKSIWGYMHWVPLFTNKVVKLLREHRKNIILKREELLLPTTQEEIVNLRKIEKDKKEAWEKIGELDDIIHELQQERNKVYNSIRNMDRLLKGKTEVEYVIDEWTGREITIEKGDKSGFSVKCPNVECRGFLKEEKCELCGIEICKDCHEILVKNGLEKGKKEHTCSKEIVATIKQLKKDTKPCVKCGILIYKIDGCDQMWCTECHTAFSWNTGKIESKIHNPHYYEWIRKSTGNEPPPNQAPNCGGGFDPKAINMAYSSSLALDILYSYRNFIETQTLILPTYRPGNDTDPQNKVLRKRFLLKEIDEESFKKTLILRDKKRQMTREYYLILDTYIKVGEDIFAKLSEYAKNRDRGKQKIDKSKRYEEFLKLREYIVDQLEEVRIAHGSRKKVQLIF